MSERHPPSDDVHTLRGPERGGALPPEVERAVLAALGIPEERVERLRAIARLVGGDWGMRVELGEPGGGSFFSETEGRIQLDPLHLSGSEHERGAEFIVAHEGGHRAITRGPEKIGLKREKARELYEKVGFAFGANACEDPADNNWWSTKYEGLAELPKEWYHALAATDAAMSVTEAERTMGIPAIREMIRALGRVPRFVHFGYELQRFWHAGKFAASGLPDDVRSALESVAPAAREYFGDVPGEHPDESEVIERARSRFQTFHDRIWPEMQRLVAEDLKDERLREMVEQSSASPTPSGGGGESSPLDELPEDLKQELEQAMREAVDRAAAGVESAGESEARECEEDARKLREAAGRLRVSSSALPTPSDSPSTREGEKRVGEEASGGVADNLDARAFDLEEQARGLRAQAAARATDLREGKVPQPVPLDRLSGDLRRALEEAYAKLPADVRAKLEAAAQRALEALEDTLNGELEGKLTPDKPESHAERHEREDREAVDREAQERRARKEAAAREEITRALEQQKTPYDRAYEAVAPLIDRLVDDLERLFQKQRHPRWKSGFPWSRLDLRKAMQVEADPSRYWDLGEHKTIPEKHDRTFTLLVDLSGSMDGEKIAETFKAAVLIAEALARVGIEVEILGFHSQLKEFRASNEPMSDTVRSRMAGMVAEASKQNPRAGATDTGYAIATAADRLMERPARERFLIVLTDGHPEPIAAHAGPEWEIGSVLARIAERGSIRTLGIGIGAGTEAVRTYFKNNAVPSSVTALPASLAALFEDMIANPETY